MPKVKKITAIKIASQTRDSAKYNVSRLISSKSSPGHSVRVDLSQELYPHASASVIGNISVPASSRPATEAEAPVIDDAVVAGFAIATPISITPASAQVGVDTPLGGVRVGPEPRYHDEYDRRYRAYGYDRGYRGCRTVTIERDDGSVRRVRRCD